MGSGRIRGVSFRRTSPGMGGKLPLPSSPQAGFSWATLAIEIKKGAPPRLTRSDVRRLLGDHGRHEIHTLVSDAVEHCSRWRQVWRSLDKSLNYNQLGRDRRELELDAADALPPENEHAALLVEARHVFGLWRHRLEILDLIVAAQPSMNWEHRL